MKGKNKILSIILTCLLFLALLPIAVSADEGGVYLNGRTGDDTKNGNTKETAVKTFTKAKELAGNEHNIIITGTVTVSDTETWKLENSKIIRATEDNNPYGETLIIVDSDAVLTLKNITIDGGSVDVFSPLIEVRNKGKLIINDGTVLENNFRTTDSGQWSYGGAIKAEGPSNLIKFNITPEQLLANNSTIPFVTDHAEIEMNGGVIRNCKSKYGGAIGLSDNAVFTMNDGIIENCIADGVAYSSGGAISAFNGSLIEMNGGTIQNNEAIDMGGAIALGEESNSYFVRLNRDIVAGVRYEDPWLPDGSQFIMTGGTIQNNTSACEGGGLYMQCNSKAVITGGDFIGNHSQYGYFGGGAIYVNGGLEKYGLARTYVNKGREYTKDREILNDAELHISNASIHDNYADFAGGGLALCPTTTTNISMIKGALIYNNNINPDYRHNDAITQGMKIGRYYYYGGPAGGDEIFVSNSDSFIYAWQKPFIDPLSAWLSEYMLGGGRYLWKDAEGKDIALDNLHNHGVKNIELYNDLTETSPDVIKGEELVDVHFIGNRSDTRGGAIGSNGVVIIGETNGDVIDIPVIKRWKVPEGTVLPDEVKVWLLRDGEEVACQYLTKDNNNEWHTVFDDQPVYDPIDHHEYTYTAKEDENIVGFIGTVAGGAEPGSLIITNVPGLNPNNPTKTSKPGLEKWIISEDPIICFGDTFRSGGTFVSIVIDGHKVLTTKDRFAFEGDGSTDQLIASFLANNRGEAGHNEHQWGYKAKAVAGKPHCLMIVPVVEDADHPHIAATECEIVGMGGHDRIFMPLKHKVKDLDVEPGEVVTYTLISNVPDTLGDYLEPEPADEPVQTMAVMGVRSVVPERGHYNLTFHDVLDSHLAFDPESVVVTITLDQDSEQPRVITLVKDEDYTLEYPVAEDGDGCTFHVSMDLVQIAEKYEFTFEQIESAPPIVVTFNATVNEGTEHGAYPNEAWVSYEDETSERDIVHVHVYAIDVLKYDQADYSFIVCLGDTFRSGGTYVSFKIGDEKIITTKDRFAFDGDHSTTELVDSFIANNPDALDHNEHQWGYRAEAVEGQPTCIRIVPLSSAKIISRAVDSGYFVGLGGHDAATHPEDYPVEITFDGGSEVRIPLQGGEFALYDNAECNGDPIATGVSDEHGLVTFEGLDSGVYYLKETKAPDGYIRNKNPLRVVVTETDSHDPVIHIAHTKFANSNIPHTGGEGTTQFTIIGAVLLVASAVVFVISKKKKKDKAH